MGIAETNRITELETKVATLTRQHQELTELVRQIADNKLLESNPPKRGPGRPPKVTGHIQPND